MNHNVLVFGANGMLGRATTAFFARRGDATTAVTRARFDIARDDFAALRRVVEGYDVIINCAGVIKPMIASTAIEDVLRVNAIFPHNLALAAPHAHIFHVTTDCVYTGSQGGYDENAAVDAEDVYGLSKAAGDNAPAMTLRTSIIGEEVLPGRSLLAWAASQRGKSVNGFTNHRWNGVTTVELARIIAAVVDDGAYRIGRFHVHSPDVLTKDEMLRLFDDVYELGLDVIPKEAALPCDRSLRSLHPLGAAYGTPSFREQLVQMRAFFAEIEAAAVRESAR
jgi:dTDP-4-dehydrorhamnose reductase